MIAKTTITALLGSVAGVTATTYAVPSVVNNNGLPFEGFVSYSIELSSFPDFAGNKSAPNKYSDNLLNNLGDIIGSKPRIRVGGNTQDFALYNASQDVGLIGIVDPAKSPDYPTTIHIGPSFFESYHTWPGVKFSHGLNLALAANNSAGWESLVETVPLACKALSHGNLNTWEYGNEPDLYGRAVRPPGWNESIYVWQWNNGTREIQKQVQKYCPKMASRGQPLFMAPSFAGTSNEFSGPLTWADGLDNDTDIQYFSTHNYISGAMVPGVTLQGTLMNHTRMESSVNAHTVEYNKILAISPNAPPLIFGECNSLYNQGSPGLSNTFGAALWGIDFNLYSASVGFKRVHMHQGTNYRYQSWQPVTTNLTVIGTKAPYYGNIAVASMLGNFDSRPVSISGIPLTSDMEAAYAAHYTTGKHCDGPLARIMVINMNGYNTTVGGAGLDPLPSPAERPTRSYTFSLDGVREGRTVNVQRLLANGSDAITGITFDGWSYNYDLDLGKPVRLQNVTVGETTTVKNGEVTVAVPDSSAVLLSFGKKK